MTFMVENIYINNRSLRGRPPEYYGTIKLNGDSSEITLRVDESFCRKVIELCADNIVETANETAKLMKNELIESLPALEVEND